MSETTPRFSRRDVLGGAAVVGAGLLVGPAAAAAQTGSGGAVFGQRLGTLSGASPVIAAARRFVLAGVEWTSPAAARIEMRARRAAGGWSPWVLASVRGHGPDRPASAGLQSGEPSWFGPADELQLRSTAPVHGVRVQFVAAAAVDDRLAGAETADARARAADLPLAQPVLPAGPGQPPIIARSAWAGNDHPQSAGPYYGAIDMAFVHHSDGANGYGAGEVPAIILAIYIFHRYTRGWFDIGYNFVIDAFGRIWEARAGGIDLQVIGAQAGGYNAESTGVCMLGTFVSQLPTPAAMAALESLLAWKLPLHGVPILGKVQVEVDPASAFYTPFRPGQLVRLPRVAGHRDGDTTTCPGNDLYGALPSVRTRIHALAGTPAQLTLTVSRASVGPHTPVVLAGRLTQLDGPPIPGAPVEVQTVAGVGMTTTLATVTTAADGSWTAGLTPTSSVIVRAVHPAAPAAVSDLTVIDLHPDITLTQVSGTPLRVTGTITPARSHVTLDVYRRSGAHRSLVLSKRVAVHHGAFSARLGLGRRARGHLVVVARTTGGTAVAAGTSPPLALTL